MPRPRKRARLEDGLKLDLNKFVRDGFLPRQNNPLAVNTQWISSHSGEIVRALITVTKEGADRGLIRIKMGLLDQRIDLVAQPRHFGGAQWYFRCPVTQRNCSVLWMPIGAISFCSRQAWGKKVAYSTQFESNFDRAITAKEKVKDRLIGNLNRGDWDLPPKPKWMRWNTYERLAKKYISKQRMIDQCVADYSCRSG